jgi:hypothetical protein
LKKGVSDSVDGWVTSIVTSLSGANTPIQGFTSALHAGVIAPFAPAVEAVGRWQQSIVQAWTTSEGVFAGISAVISAGLIKPMEGAILAISSWLDAIRSAWNAADGVLAGIGAATGKALTHPFNESSSAVKSHGGDITKWSDTVRANMKTVGDSIDEVLKRKAGLLTDPPKEEAKVADTDPAKNKGGVDHLKNLLTNLEMQAQLQEQSAAVLGKSAGEAARYKAEIQALALLKKHDIELTNEDRQALTMYVNELGRATDAAAEAKAGYDLKNATDAGVAAKQLEIQMLGKTTAAQEQLRFSTAQYANLVRQGIPITEEWTAKIEASSQALGRAAEAAENAKQMHKQLLDYGNVVARGLEGAFSKWAEGSKVTVRDMVADMMKEMAKLAFKQGVTTLLMGSSGNGGGGLMGGLSSFLSGARADGGPVSGGSSYLVGERGPEIFQPSVSGSIIPNKAMGGGGGGSNMSMNVGITINAQGSHPDAVTGMRTEIAQQIPGMVKRAVYEMMDRDARMARMGA